MVPSSLDQPFVLVVGRKDAAPGVGVSIKLSTVNSPGFSLWKAGKSSSTGALYSQASMDRVGFSSSASLASDAMPNNEMTKRTAAVILMKASG